MVSPVEKTDTFEKWRQKFNQALEILNNGGGGGGVAAELAKKANTSDLAEVAKSGSYNDLSDKPTIPAAYTLPTASSSKLGGIKIGTGLSVDAQGVASVNMSGVIDSALNANSQNAVTNAAITQAINMLGGPISYSTNEQQVGTWIDGKPIYQKTIVHTATAVQTLTTKAWTTISIPDVPRQSEVDTLVDSILINRQVLSNPVSNCVLNITYYLDANGGLYYFSDVAYAWTQLILTLRYTKTTD